MFHIKFGWMSKITIIHIGKISSSTSFLPGCSTQKTRHPTFGVSLLRAAQRTGPRGEKRPPPGRRRRARPGQGHGFGGWVKTGLLRLFWVSYLRCFWMCLIGDLRLFWGCSEVVLRLFWGSLPPIFWTNVPESTEWGWCWQIFGFQTDFMRKNSWQSSG